MCLPLNRTLGGRVGGGDRGEGEGRRRGPGREGRVGGGDRGEREGRRRGLGREGRAEGHNILNSLVSNLILVELRGRKNRKLIF